MNDELISDWIDALFEAFPGMLTKLPMDEESAFVWDWFLDITSPIHHEVE